MSHENSDASGFFQFMSYFFFSIWNFGCALHLKIEFYIRKKSKFTANWLQKINPSSTTCRQFCNWRKPTEMKKIISKLKTQ